MALATRLAPREEAALALWLWTYVCRFKISSMGGNVGIECIEDDDDALNMLRMTEPDGSLVMESVTMASEALDYGRGCFESCGHLACAIKSTKYFVYGLLRY